MAPGVAGGVAPPEVVAAEEDLAAEQGHQGAGGVARHRDQAQVGVEIQGLLPLQQVFGAGGGVGVGGVDPAGAAEALRPAVVVGHVVAVREHNRLQAAQGFDLPGQGRVEAGGVDQHVPRRPHNQVAAGPEAPPRRPAAVVHLPRLMRGEQGRKAIGGSAPHQCGRRLDRRHRTGAQGQQGPAWFPPPPPAGARRGPRRRWAPGRSAADPTASRCRSRCSARSRRRSWLRRG